MDPAGELLLATGQAVGAVEFCGQKLLAGHSSHAALPPEALYVPATQGAQAPPSGPVYPATQEQLVQKLDSGGEVV
jgi:hypothetical protein